MKNFLKLGTLILLVNLLNGISLFASDRTDAIELLNKSEAEAKQLEIAVKNFGDKGELADYEQGLNIIKLGKVKLAQSNYLDAKAKFDEYIKLQYKIYQSLAGKYIQRVEKLIDETSNDLVNFVGNEKVLKNFETASSQLNVAKQNNATKHYMETVGTCRIAKKYLFANYEIAGKKLPDQYQKDLTDCNNKIQ